MGFDPCVGGEEICRLGCKCRRHQGAGGYTYTCRKTRIQHENWPKGCITTIATSVGARIRHQLDRESTLYKEIYKQRTATERINSQAKELGIERPRLRNGQAITNQNTLIYVLINLRALHRVRQKKHDEANP